MFHRALVLSTIALAALVGCSTMPADKAAPRVRSPDAATGRLWRWEATVTSTEKINVPAPDRYTLELQSDGVALVRADCNRGRGSFEIGEGRIKFGPLATTRMACPPGSLDSRYLRELNLATSFFVEGDQLFLELPADSGTMRFARVK